MMAGAPFVGVQPGNTTLAALAALTFRNRRRDEVIDSGMALSSYGKQPRRMMTRASQ
jgi:hypothetical protein